MVPKVIRQQLSRAHEVVKMIIEMRTYNTAPGMRSRLLAIFHSVSNPARREIEITASISLIGSGLATLDP